jgi:Tfp pilus assembly protein PilV
MKSMLNKDQRGLAPVAMVLLAAVVLGGVGYVGYTVMNKDKGTKGATKELSAALEVSEKECMKEMDDKDLCKFFSNWSVTKKFAISSSDTSEGTTTTSVMKIDGDKTYMKTSGEMSYEVITIGDTTYTKAGDTWWKQTAKKTTEDTTPKVDTEDYKFEEPKKDAPEAEQTKYVKVGKEACGDKTCFKYKVVDPGNTESTEYIWFDDDEYLTRKTRTESKDGSVSEQVYTYTNISVSAPTPVKELAENQYIMPGSTEPMTMPSAADFGVPTE